MTSVVLGFLPRQRSAKKRIGKAKQDAEKEFFIFSKNFQKINRANAQIWIFLK